MQNNFIKKTKNMFDQLFEFVMTFLDKLLPFVVINYYDRGVRLRFGKPCGSLEPGFHWKIPFVDHIDVILVKTDTMELREQTLTTKDDQTIVVKAVLKFEISDASLALLEVYTPRDACADMVQGIIREKIVETNWADCNGKDIQKAILTTARQEANKWGIKILAVTFTDLAKIRTIRLMTGAVFNG